MPFKCYTKYKIMRVYTEYIIIQKFPFAAIELIIFLLIPDSTLTYAGFYDSNIFFLILKEIPFKSGMVV